MKTVLTAIFLIVITGLLVYIGTVSPEVGWAVIAYLIIQIPKRDTQRKIEDASRNPKVKVEHQPDKSASRFAR